ncbi:thiaminase II [Endozoicomonas sp. OPT23]|uniref:thiaminase II n=1 Tax=Endozoicomonas sp. OPT23 TaxID=2072845 RepID=UPI00129A5E3B|nr:thiaminase II [Endozoicomonas sp. OPT23]MRI33056.1 thiaminase II [Endozoicomonas sp. OPT23]
MSQKETSDAFKAFNNPDSLYFKIKQACSSEWHDYCHHEFVTGIQDGSLPLDCFKHYLQQDYLFLIHFARAYALAVYKSDSIADMRTASGSVSGILAEMNLHLDYCAEWGLSEEEVVSKPESQATMAYTRYVLERGMAGDILDLHVALSPCAVGYAEIGLRLINDPATQREGNPYWQWIQTYGGEEFVSGSIRQVETLDQLAESRFNDGRMDSLCRTFKEATRLEIGFWDMGWNKSF